MEASFSFCSCSQGVKTIAPQQVGITVKPSSRAANIEVHYKGNDGELIPITAGEELEGACGDSITGIGGFNRPSMHLLMISL